MAWRRPMLVSLPTHICFTRPQWVNTNLSEIVINIHIFWFKKMQFENVVWKSVAILSRPLCVKLIGTWQLWLQIYVWKVWNVFQGVNSWEHPVKLFCNKCPKTPLMLCQYYRQVSNIRCSLVGNQIFDHYIFILNLKPGFNRLGKDNYKMRRQTFKFWYLVRLILETLRYFR